MGYYSLTSRARPRYVAPPKPAAFSDDDIARIVGTDVDAAQKRNLFATINANLALAFDEAVDRDGDKKDWLKRRSHTGATFQELGENGSLESLEILAGYALAQKRIQFMREITYTPRLKW